MVRHLILLVVLAFPIHLQAAADATGYRVLHVMSYHASWKWNRDQFAGFRQALDGVPVAYRVVELDTKRNSDPASIAARAAEARRLIAEWRPDLLYTNDDNAQAYLGQDYVDGGLPVVFSGVNRDPSEYGFVGAENVTGVLEQEHLVPTLRLLRQVAGPIRRIAVVVDDDPTWKGVMARIRSTLRQLPDIEVTHWVLARTQSQFQAEILALQDQVDAIAMLGVFNIKDDRGRDVDYEQMLEWVADNSRVPDFSFWQTRVERGTLCAVAESGFEQGRLAGTMARRILVDGTSPADIPMQPSVRGLPMVSLARARRLGLQLDVNLLLDVRAIADFAWER
jgi:ABC-type uncharacterized transport system substrate-binding protein